LYSHLKNGTEERSVKKYLYTINERCADWSYRFDTFKHFLNLQADFGNSSLGYESF
jgi:hypothetical protein